MSPAQLLGAWAFQRGRDPTIIAEIAAGLEPPDMQLRLRLATEDTITVEVADGVVPHNPDTLLYVQERGAFEVLLRVEESPGHPVLLTLAAWPRR